MRFITIAIVIVWLFMELLFNLRADILGVKRIPYKQLAARFNISYSCINGEKRPNVKYFRGDTMLQYGGYADPSKTERKCRLPEEKVNLVTKNNVHHACVNGLAYGVFYANPISSFFHTNTIEFDEPLYVSKKDFGFYPIKCDWEDKEILCIDGLEYYAVYYNDPYIPYKGDQIFHLIGSNYVPKKCENLYKGLLGGKND